MYILKLLVILHLLVSTQIEARRKIFGGEAPADTKDIPILVKVSVYNGVRTKGKPLSTNSCGGSYIRPNWVLSATHCVEAYLPLKNHKPKYDVVLCMGSIIVIPWNCPGELTRLADELHPFKETEGWQKDDIMLIKVLKPWVEGPTIKIAKLPPPKVPRKTYNGKKCLIAGWGLTGINEFAKTMKQATVTLYVDQEDKCLTSNDKQICAVGGSGITCKGDSGGPLMCDGILVGALQGGMGACNSTTTKTSVFNLIESYRDWIVKIAGAGANSIVPNNVCLFIFTVIPLAIFN